MNSKNEKVQEFLEELEAIDNEKYIILEKLREILFDCYSETDERIMYGGIMFSDEYNIKLFTKRIF